MTTEFDVETGKWEVKITGTGLRDAADSGDMSDLQLNGKSQTIKSHSDTMAVFTVDEVTALTTTDVDLFFPVGIPAGNDLVKAGITVEPKLMMISPNVGTPGGTLIRATVPGVGTSMTGLDLIDASGRTVCKDDAKVVSYGILECWTRRDDMGVDPFEVKLKNGDAVIECATEDKTKCNYKQNNENKD
jgi:hypothetical protein